VPPSPGPSPPRLLLESTQPTAGMGSKFERERQRARGAATQYGYQCAFYCNALRLILLLLRVLLPINEALMFVCGPEIIALV
jgi:hypothetical protein